MIWVSLIVFSVVCVKGGGGVSEWYLCISIIELSAIESYCSSWNSISKENIDLHFFLSERIEIQVFSP